jgi:hypothetical protein
MFPPMVRKVRDLYAGRLLDANYDCATSFAIFAIFTAIRRASLRVSSFVVLCVMMLCVSVVRLGGNSLLLRVVKKLTPCRVGITIAEKAVLSICGRCGCNADAKG